MEKKISAVQRWLDRCLVACRSRSWESALSDMECAAAELENARRSLWSVVDQAPQRPRGRVTRSVGTVLAATIFVLMAALPLSTSDPIRFERRGLAWQDQEALLELVTLDEQNLLRALRKNLSGANLVTVPASVPKRPQEVQQPERRASLPKESVPVVREKPSQKTVPLDEVMSLIEIGQRALRSDGNLVILGDVDGL